MSDCRSVARRGLTAAVLILLAVAPRASAHAMPTSAVELTVNAHAVRGELRLPRDRLAVALGRTPAATALEHYSAANIRAVGDDGRAWRVLVSAAHVEGADWVETLTLTPPGGKVTAFDLRYDVILAELVTHRAIVTLQTRFAAPRTLGVLDWTRHTIHVSPGESSWLHGLLATARLGVQHIGEGADHLLFLLMLLLPAPLFARAGRWRRSDDARRSVIRVVHVVTAFAVGHSTTLALAALGVVHAPARVVESLIALSIAVSAVHAIRPLIPRGEPLIAAGFGLVHGLAFATLLGGLGLHGSALVVSLLGFNLGIELTQLLVVALVMPSLYLLSRTAVYDLARVTIAGFGLVLSGGWLLERTTLIGHDPFAPVSDALIAHPFAVVAVFALFAATTASLPLKTGATTA
jgi:hypothetical protein